MSGELPIAELPIGDDGTGLVYWTPDPIYKSVISEYANSPIFLQLVQNMQSYFDPTVNFNLFYDQIWNIDTAQGYGLDVWGRIVGVGRVLQLPIATGVYLGFVEATDAHSFNEGIWNGGGALTYNYFLSDTAYRKLILAKALANISDGSIPSINQILINLFGSYGNCYVIDNENMTLTYSFAPTLSVVDHAIVFQSGVIPKPVGVRAIFQQR